MAMPPDPNARKGTLKSITRAAFDRVVAANGRLGGDLLVDPCYPSDLKYTYASGRAETAKTCGCGKGTRLAVPYEGEDSKAHFATLCALCDGAVLMPRFDD